MLSGITQENCSKVSARISETFQKMMVRSEFHVDFYIASVAEIGLEEQDQRFSFLNDGNIWEK